MAGTDLTAQVGSITLPTPVMTASGTIGHGDEFVRFMDFSKLGAVVTKSLSCFPHLGNPAPRVTEAPGAMLNSVGLPGPGVKSWLENEFPALLGTGGRIVVSIWGRSVNEFQEAAVQFQPAAASLTALELNISCPNLEKSSKMFSHSAEMTAEVVDACKESGIPIWVKLSPTTPDIPEVVQAAREAGSEAATLLNTIPAMRIDAKARKPYLGGIQGGLSGPALKPVSLRAVYECHNAIPDFPIIGAGGIRTGEDVAEYLMAGASAVEVGTALFLDPRAAMKIQRDFLKWCGKNSISRISEITLK